MFMEQFIMDKEREFFKMCVAVIMVLKKEQ